MKALILSLLATTSAIGAVTMANPSSASAGEVYNREVNQERRIYDGVKDGQINRSEFRHLEAREERIDAQRRADLRQNGGHLTAAEYKQLNREENRASNAIYRDRHN